MGSSLELAGVSETPELFGNSLIFLRAGNFSEIRRHFFRAGNFPEIRRYFCVPEIFRKFSGNFPDIFRKFSGNSPTCVPEIFGNFLSRGFPEISEFLEISGNFSMLFLCHIVSVCLCTIFLFQGFFGNFLSFCCIF